MTNYIKTKNKRLIVKLIKMVCFMCIGSLFHSLGPATEKAQSPADTKFVRGTARIHWFLDLRLRTERAGESMLLR